MIWRGSPQKILSIARSRPKDSSRMEHAMKLSAALVRQTLSQFDARAIPVTHPAVPKLSELYGDHTFFLNDNGLSIIEPVDSNDGVTSTAKVVNLANWRDSNQTSLAPHNPVPTSKIIVLVGGPIPPASETAGD